MIIKDQREKLTTFHEVSELMAIYGASFFVCFLEQRFKSHTNPGSCQQGSHIRGGGGINWATDCMMQWFIDLGSIDHNYTFHQLYCITTPNLWNGIEIALWSKKLLVLFLIGTFSQLTPLPHPSAPKTIA